MDFDSFWHRTVGRPYKLHVETHGNPTKPTIILLHGIAASSDDWSKLIPLLQAKFFCVTIDLLGFAKSPKPQWARYDMDDHLRSIHYTIRRLRLSRGFVLAGHSLGSLLAARYARQYPQSVQRLLLLSPPVYPSFELSDTHSAARRTNLLLRLYKFLRTHPRMTPANIRRLSLIIPLPRSIVTHPLTWTPFVRSLEHCIEQQTIIDDIRAVRSPIDVFYGSLDSVVVGANVRLLSGSGVNLHAFRGNHNIGQTYAQSVAAVLGIKPTRTKSRTFLRKNRTPRQSR